MDKRPLAQKMGNGNYGRVIRQGRSKAGIKYKEYCYWSNMYTRCNNSKYSDLFPTYKDVTISKYFSDYNNFVDWCRSKKEFFYDNFVLDKDIVKPNNKMYHEDYCNFVPKEVNGFFVLHNNKRQKSLPLGVSWCESEGKYKTYCSQLNGKNKTLGRFNNEVDAGISYINFKNSMAGLLLDKWRNVLSEEVIFSLENYDVRNYVQEDACNHFLYLEK